MTSVVPPDKRWKYARPERERRFLLADVPPGLVVRTTRIEDRYLVGTRLRLRRAIEIDGNAERTLLKLTQRIPGEGGDADSITTAYLSDAEYSVLATLPASELRKTRYSIPPFGIDVFEAPLDGLVIAEIEFESDDAMKVFKLPRWAVAEVTRDQRLTGGELARETSDGIRETLAEFGLPGQVNR